MSAAELSRAASVSRQPSVGPSLLGFMRSHPVASFFVLAYSSWLWQVPTFAIFHKPIALAPWMLFVPFLLPTTAGFVMAWVTSGRIGMVDLARRIVRWRVGLQWYAVVLLTMPVFYLAGMVALPGGLGALQLPGWSFLGVALGSFAFNVFGAGVMEEPGWRGYALPRLQQRHGPLAGTLILGSLWATWHLPLFLFLPRHDGVQPGFLGMAIPFLTWALGMLGFAVLITWVVNNGRGSVLLAMLFHASNNLSYDSLPSAFFPTLFSPAMAARAPQHPVTVGAVLLAAILVIVMTRGRLGYDRNRSQVDPPIPERALSRQTEAIS